MRFEVLLTEDAARDLEEIHDYITANDDPAKADHVLARLEATLESLVANPERGSCPRELLALGIREYRQVFFKPYRMIYRIMGRHVYVYLIADGRRDMQLHRRPVGLARLNGGRGGLLVMYNDVKRHQLERKLINARLLEISHERDYVSGRTCSRRRVCRARARRIHFYRSRRP
jgi:toxin ParE1/3/4